jgi:hypothetical protein
MALKFCQPHIDYLSPEARVIVNAIDDRFEHWREVISPTSSKKIRDTSLNNTRMALHVAH